MQLVLHNIDIQPFEAGTHTQRSISSNRLKEVDNCMVLFGPKHYADLS